jgi:hypothetical protein
LASVPSAFTVQISCGFDSSANSRSNTIREPSRFQSGWKSTVPAGGRVTRRSPVPFGWIV